MGGILRVPREQAVPLRREALHRGRLPLRPPRRDPLHARRGQLAEEGHRGRLQEPGGLCGEGEGEVLVRLGGGAGQGPAPEGGEEEGRGQGQEGRRQGGQEGRQGREQGQRGRQGGRGKEVVELQIVGLCRFRFQKKSQ